MDDPKSLAIPTIKQPIEEGKPYLIEIRTPCPICNASWAATFREKIARVSQIAGSIGDVFTQGERKAIKLDSSGWGAHALCGDCYAMRIVTIEPTDGGRRIIPWTPKIEAEMFGRLKHQQNRFHAVATVLGPATGEETLIDEQQERRIEIIGRQNTLISEGRLKALGLEKWVWRT